MRDWNVVVTVREKGFILACEFMEEFGRVEKTPFYNVLVMKVGDIREFMEGLQREISESSMVTKFLARVIPVSETFDFQNPEEFESKAKEVVLRSAPQLSGKRFHVRMHRRGFKGRLSTMEEERILAETILQFLESAGTPGRIEFEDPDAVLTVEVLGPRSGFSLWTREELERYPLLRPD